MSQATAGTLDITFKAGEALTAKQYHFVKLNGSSGIVPCKRTALVSDPSVGILQNAPKINRAARVRILGTSKLVMSEACSEMDNIITDNDGHGIKAITHKDFVGAIALEAATDADEIIEVIVTHMYIPG